MRKTDYHRLKELLEGKRKPKSKCCECGVVYDQDERHICNYMFGKSSKPIIYTYPNKQEEKTE